MQETRVQSLGQEDPLEKEMATHSSTLAWKIPRTEERGRLQSMGSQRVRHDWVTSLSLSAFFMVQLSRAYMTTGKTIALTRRTFVSKVMSLLFNTLSRLVTAFLPRRSVVISWLQSPSAVILEPKKMKSVTISIVSPSICHEAMGPDAMILVFWMLSFKASFFTLLFHFHQEALQFLFTFCHKGGVICISLLIFLPAILIPAYASSSPAFHMMYSAYKLNKKGDNIQSWHTPFPIWNQSVVPCPVLTVAS